MDNTIKTLAEEFKQLCKSVDLKEKKTRLLELEAKTTDPSFWNDQKSAKIVMQEFGDLKEEIEQIEKVEKVIQDAQAAVELKIDEDFDERVKESRAVLRKLKLTTYLSGPYDKKNAILSIHAGQGGTEAMDWVSMLFRMYLKYFEKRGWKAEILEENSGEEAGLKNVSIKVEGQYVYGYLKGEVGTHRLVRQSPFNADKLRQTSFALVEVLPELENVDLPDVEIKEDDLDWQFFRASGHGGQNVQKVSTAVRLKHKPTGITVTSQTERYQEQNRKYALEHLRAKLWVRQQAELDAEKKQIAGEYRPAAWGTQIRSYVLHPYKMVKDLRTEVETSDADGVLDGELDSFIEAELELNNS